MLINDLNTLGFLFEALCERDLRIYAESYNAKLYHYQDYDGDEIDSVVELDNGDWVAIEIKLGSNQIDEAANSLLKIKNKILDNGGKPLWVAILNLPLYLGIPIRLLYFVVIAYLPVRFALAHPEKCRPSIIKGFYVLSLMGQALMLGMHIYWMVYFGRLI